MFLSLLFQVARRLSNLLCLKWALLMEDHLEESNSPISSLKMKNFTKFQLSQGKELNLPKEKQCHRNNGWTSLDLTTIQIELTMTTRQFQRETTTKWWEEWVSWRVPWIKDSTILIATSWPSPKKMMTLSSQWTSWLSSKLRAQNWWNEMWFRLRNYWKRTHYLFKTWTSSCPAFSHRQRRCCLHTEPRSLVLMYPISSSSNSYPREVGQWWIKWMDRIPTFQWLGAKLSTLLLIKRRRKRNLKSNL